MATITLKNIPEKTYLRLKDLARRHHRSLNGEMLHALDEYVDGRERFSAEEIRTRAEQFRGRVKGERAAELVGESHAARL